ncbi:MAG: response regulator [Candidatus Peregrinibacteria bacterium]|nr:response regulator [Candidatus Peregrinibacteria bacterium]MCB9807790.1 response regulator [Candidatus Peribacteria bacterium]
MSHTILIAEDDKFLAETIAASLQDHGQETRIALNGEYAIEAMDLQQPAILLLDLLMPVVDGHGVLKHYKEKGYTFPVIMLSNLSDDVNKESCKEMGAKDYFIKSDMDEDDLWPIVEKYL